MKWLIFITILYLFLFIPLAVFAQETDKDAERELNNVRQFVTFSTINKYMSSTTNFDEVDDTRDFTSEALLASSKKKLNRNLTEDELSGIIRTKNQFETANRLVLHYETLPTFDIFYKHQDINKAQITNFSEPNSFNDVNLNEIGVAIEKTIKVPQFYDFLLRGSYKRIEREGIIEFLPDEKENINHYETKAVVSRYLDPDEAKKIKLEFTYVFQDINPDISNPPKRNRQIFATTVTYQFFRPRGIDIFSGVAYDKERFEDTDVKRYDFFIGTSFKGLKAFENINDFDITIQPTIFTSDNERDKSQNNSQYQTNLTLLYRILEEEKVLKIDLESMQLVIPFKYDISLEGPKDFENFRVGIHLITRLFANSFLKIPFQSSLGYEHQHFPRLNENKNIILFNLGMEF